MNIGIIIAVVVIVLIVLWAISAYNGFVFFRAPGQKSFRYLA